MLIFKKLTCFCHYFNERIIGLAFFGRSRGLLLSTQDLCVMKHPVHTLVVESCPVEIRPLFENPGNLKPGKNKPGRIIKIYPNLDIGGRTRL